MYVHNKLCFHCHLSRYDHKNYFHCVIHVMYDREIFFHCIIHVKYDHKIFYGYCIIHVAYVNNKLCFHCHVSR